MLAALWLAAAPLAAQTVSPDASSLALAPPCSSAKAVHDMRCPNYTGFKPRVGAAADAAPRRQSAGQDDGPARVGRDLQRGIASWYGPRFHGRTTANGEKYDMDQLTAAHKTLPFGTRVLVHSPRTGREVVVRINDRGPYARGRVIDLSKAAATALGMQSRGHDAVVLREVLPPGRADEVLASAD
ncbi:septal ring lytic transglycosylase RlpA family protein [Ottowia sp.]|uniref:septal ring lytic transglycosylase RlpA family protein n=1 Tax=Ottowia sp. TaxID=1898956 RepID=UPI0039E6D861